MTKTDMKSYTQNQRRLRVTTNYQNTDWFEVLNKACKTESQAKVAAKCGFSATALNQVLKGTYKGSLTNIQEKVSGALLKQQVICPVLDEITTDICAGYRKGGFLPTNPMRVQLYHACQTCKNNPKNQGE